MLPTVDERERLTLCEAAEYLAVSRPTLLRALREGRAPGLRLSGRWVISRQALDRLLGDGGSLAAFRDERPDAGR